MALDWWQLGADAFAALGTLAAVVVSLLLASRDSRGRRRDQASMITTYFGTTDPGLPAAGQSTIVIANGSAAGIYDVLVALAAAWGSAPPDQPLGGVQWLTSVPPGDWYFEGPTSDGEAMNLRLGILIEFADAQGKRWRREADGRLVRVDEAWLKRVRADSKPESRAITRLHR